MTDFKVGDRVRVTFEAVVADNSASGGACLCNLTNGGARIRQEYLRQEGVEVEKIEPPFKPGEVVRNRHTGNTYTLTNDGYVSHSTGTVWNDGAEWRDKTFTTKNYELVEV